MLLYKSERGGKRKGKKRWLLSPPRLLANWGSEAGLVIHGKAVARLL